MTAQAAAPVIETGDNPYAAWLFARGYIARTNAAPKAPTSWLRKTFGDLHLAHDARLSAVESQDAGSKVLCLGLLFDVREPDISTEDCIQRLTSALTASEEQFLSELQYTCGRYVCLYRRMAASPEIVSDATGMKPVFYGGGEAKYVSSHVELIAHNEPEMTLIPRLPFRYGYPGIATPRRGIRLLTPNTTLNITTFRVSRFWPTHSLPSLPLNDAVDIVQGNLNNAARHVCSRFSPLVSVTAGLDLRTTLSTVLGKPNVRYFTYDTGVSSMKFDRALCKAFRDAGLVDSELIQTKDILIDSAFNQIMKANSIGEHSNKLSYLYFTKFGNKEKLLHIRSNIAEVGREFWGKSNIEIDQHYRMSDIYLLYEKYSDPKSVSRIKDFFEEFFRISSFGDAIGKLDSKSLFYWEFRMAKWHSQLVAESDPAFDTISLFNCRHTLATMLSVSKAHRKGGDIQKAVILRNSPELAKFPINGKPFSNGRSAKDVLETVGRRPLRFRSDLSIPAPMQTLKDAYLRLPPRLRDRINALFRRM